MSSRFPGKNKKNRIIFFADLDQTDLFRIINLIFRFGPDGSISDNQSSSVTLNELAMKARKSYCNFKHNPKTDVNLNKVQIILTV